MNDLIQTFGVYDSTCVIFNILVPIPIVITVLIIAFLAYRNLKF